MRTLRDINSHILDMSKSTWVDAKDVEHTFNTKTWNHDIKGLISGASTLKTKTYYNPNGKPDHWIWWVRYNPPKYMEFQTAKVTLPATAVSIDTDPYWPEGLVPDAEGYFVFGDLILMKRKYVDHLRDEVERIKRSRGGAKAAMDEFNELAKREGVAISGKAKEDVGSAI